MSPTEKTAVYRLYDASGNLLYIGCTGQPEHRWMDHKATKAWWPEVARRDLSWYADRKEATSEERRAILAENPRYNRARVELRPAALPPPIWAPIRAELAERLTTTGRRYERTARRLREVEAELAALVYEALCERAAPREVRDRTGSPYEEVARLWKGHVRRHPDLPPVPLRQKPQRDGKARKGEH